jgi:hypothetical protein
MLRACALQHGGSWDKSLPYAEFSYNNSYQASLKMSPFEALYGRKCRTPLYWDQTGERQFFGPELIQETEEQVRIILENLRVAQTRQKSYVDNRRRSSSVPQGVTTSWNEEIQSQSQIVPSLYWTIQNL